MPSRRSADAIRTADGPAPTLTAAETVGGADVYLTDEVFLYRVVRVLAGAAGEIVELEDCYLLDIVRIPVVDLGRRRLRVITPAAGRA
jgi:hypothetical protein